MSIPRRREIIPIQCCTDGFCSSPGARRSQIRSEESRTGISLVNGGLVAGRTCRVTGTGTLYDCAGSAKMIRNAAKRPGFFAGTYTVELRSTNERFGWQGILAILTFDATRLPHSPIQPCVSTVFPIGQDTTTTGRPTDETARAVERNRIRDRWFCRPGIHG